MKPQEEERKGTEVTGSSLTKVLADLIISQSLSSDGEKVSASGASVLPCDQQSSPVTDLSSETRSNIPGLSEDVGPETENLRPRDLDLTEAEQVNPMDLSRPDNDAVVQSDIDKLMMANKDLWNKYFQP